VTLLYSSVSSIRQEVSHRSFKSSNKVNSNL